jgi:hypothetical protein
VFDAVEVRALCRPVKFFHIDLDEPFLYGLRFVYGGIVMLEQGLPQTVATKLEAVNRLECHCMLRDIRMISKHLHFFVHVFNHIVGINRCTALTIPHCSDILSLLSVIRVDGTEVLYSGRTCLGDDTNMKNNMIFFLFNKSEGIGLEMIEMLSK